MDKRKFYLPSTKEMHQFQPCITCSVLAAVFFLLDVAAVFFVAFLFFVATTFPFFVEVVSGAGLAMGLLLMMKSGSGNGPCFLDSMLG
jgi:hypothetical protein